MGRKSNPPANAGDTRDSGSIPALGRSPGVGNGNGLQYSVDRGARYQGQDVNLSFSRSTIHSTMSDTLGKYF